MTAPVAAPLALAAALLRAGRHTDALTHPAVTTALADLIANLAEAAAEHETLTGLGGDPCPDELLAAEFARTLLATVETGGVPADAP